LKYNNTEKVHDFDNVLSTVNKMHSADILKQTLFVTKQEEDFEMHGSKLCFKGSSVYDGQLTSA
jgi:hypothetical protein